MSQALVIAPDQVGFIVQVAFAYFLANVAAVVGAYISLKVGMAKLEVKVDRLEQDMDGIGENFRKLESETKSKGA